MAATQGIGGAAGRAGAAARGAARDAAPWVVRLARLGYAARGIVYVIVGFVAAQAALGRRGDVADQRGALTEIASHSGGRLILGLLAVGLVGFAVWRFVEAGLDPERDGAAKRALFALSGVVHATLALTAARMAMGSGAGRSGESGADSWAARAMEAPAGRWLVGLAALGIAAFGVQQLVQAYKAKLDKRLDLSRMGSESRVWAVRAARAGLAARGVVFAIIGFFLLQAALHRNPNETRGMSGALTALRDASYGPWLLGLVALGLMAFGVTELIKARYRRITPA